MIPMLSHEIKRTWVHCVEAYWESCMNIPKKKLNLWRSNFTEDLPEEEIWKNGLCQLISTLWRTSNAAMQHKQNNTWHFSADLSRPKFSWQSYIWVQDYFFKQWMPNNILFWISGRCLRKGYSFAAFCSIPTMMSMMALGTLCFSTVEVWLSICEMLQFDLVFPEMRCSVNKWYHCNSKEYKHGTRCVCSFWLPEQYYSPANVIRHSISDQFLG